MFRPFRVSNIFLFSISLNFYCFWDRIPDVYISKEIIQRNDLPNYSIEQRAQHVATALKRPTDKLTYKKNWIPSGRFFEDYIFHRTWKWMRSLTSIGVSINPEYLKSNVYFLSYFQIISFCCVLLLHVSYLTTFFQLIVVQSYESHLFLDVFSFCRF